MRYETGTDAPAPGPVIKWAGGKTRLLDELVARAPASFGRYFEPFAGGAALFFRLAPTRAVLNDANVDLIQMYRTLAAHPARVIAKFRMRTRCHTQQPGYYDMIRSWWNAADRGEDRDALGTQTYDAFHASAFLYLNRACFNGLWRVNRAGAFNVPQGDTTPVCDAPALMRAARQLARAELRSGDYRDAVRDARRGDFVYFDPPYDPISATSSFTKYTASDFGVAEQRQLADVARDLAAKGVHVMLSNNDTPRVRRLYRGFVIDRVMCRRSINADTTRRRAIAEVIITSRTRTARAPRRPN